MQGVSVIIPTFNRAEKLVRAVSSALSQSAPPAEVIVVDDGSTDHTKSALAPLIHRITYVRHRENRGVSAARNTGLRRSGAEFIAFLDSDDHWVEDKLAVQTRFFRRHPDAVACQTEEIWIRGGRRVNPKKKHKKPSGDIFSASLKLCLVSPSAVMLRRSLLDEVGLFDESLPACEDYDLWLRIGCRYPIHLIPEYLVVKEGGAPDQLSARYPGMDRFRIRAMVKLLKTAPLSERQRRAATEKLALKCRIYGNGCLKRGKTEEGRYYLNLPADMKDIDKCV
ncbi:MAG: glycosyltransferase family 2 protein [Deltaproteobacteria bacterium]|nr:glycosyltransferase family 2 protein [Deltaproteobacteria bacterium]